MTGAEDSFGVGMIAREDAAENHADDKDVANQSEDDVGDGKARRGWP